jgi:hypothetical protein
LGELLSFSEEGDLSADALGLREVSSSEGPPIRGENLAPCGEVSIPSFEFADGRDGHACGDRDLGLGEGLPFSEFPQFDTEAVLERFLYLATVTTSQKRNSIFTISAGIVGDDYRALARADSLAKAIRTADSFGVRVWSRSTSRAVRN